MCQHNSLGLDWQSSLKLKENLINLNLQVCCGRYVIENQLHQEMFEIFYNYEILYGMSYNIKLSTKSYNKQRRIIQVVGTYLFIYFFIYIFFMIKIP